MYKTGLSISLFLLPFIALSTRYIQLDSQARRDNLKINDRWFSLEIPIRAVNYHPPPLNHLSPAYHANPVDDEEVRSASRSFDTGVSCLPHDLIGYTRFNPLTKALPPPRRAVLTNPGRLHIQPRTKKSRQSQTQSTRPTILQKSSEHPGVTVDDCRTDSVNVVSLYVSPFSPYMGFD